MFKKTKNTFSSEGHWDAICLESSNFGGPCICYIGMNSKALRDFSPKGLALCGLFDQRVQLCVTFWPKVWYCSTKGLDTERLLYQRVRFCVTSHPKSYGWSFLWSRKLIDNFQTDRRNWSAVFEPIGKLIDSFLTYRWRNRHHLVWSVETAETHWKFL